MLRRSILIFHLGALGDFVLTWPLAMALSRLYPQSRVIYVTHPQKGELARQAIGVESASIEADWHQLYGDAGKIGQPARQLLESSQAIYSFIANQGDAWAENAQRLAAPANVRCLRPTPPNEFAGHTTDHLVQQLGGEAALAESVRQMIRSIESRGIGGRFARAADRPIALVHPGSGSKHKCWPIERYMELCEQLAPAWSLCMVLGEAELERWPKELIDRVSRRVQVATPQTAVELLDLVRSAELYIGNDSGPSHLAGMLGVATLALFGPSNPTIWRPIGPRVRVLQHRPLDDLPVEDVLSAVGELPGYRP